MAITDKNRKTLWARSGNRCAFCRTELVADRNEHNRNLNIGDECHIVSEKIGGPRYIADFGKDHDDYDNLILLCKNHHKTIDELWETYIVEILKALKTSHETWIRKAIEAANKKENDNEVRILNRITTGKQIIDLVLNAHGYRFDHDDLKTKDESDLVSTFLQYIQDLGESYMFEDYEIGRRVEIGFELNNDILSLEEKGLYIFGERKNEKMMSGGKPILFDVAMLIILHKDNSAIFQIDTSHIYCRIGISKQEPSFI